MPGSSYLEEQVQKATFENKPFSVAVAYVAIMTAAPAKGKDTAGSELAEPSYAAYARGTFGAVTITKGGPSGITLVKNTGAVTLPSTTTVSAIVTHFAIMDAKTKGTGNMLHYAELLVPLEITPALTVVEFKAGELVIGAE